jgi:hypothetical protein
MVDFPVSDAEYLAATVHPTLEIGLEELLKRQFPKQTIDPKRDDGESIDPPIRWLANWLKQHNASNTSQRWENGWNKALQTVQSDEFDLMSCCRNLVNGVKEGFWPIQVINILQPTSWSRHLPPTLCFTGICINVRDCYRNCSNRPSSNNRGRRGFGASKRTSRNGRRACHAAGPNSTPDCRGRHPPIRRILSPRQSRPPWHAPRLAPTILPTQRRAPDAAVEAVAASARRTRGP